VGSPGEKTAIAALTLALDVVTAEVVQALEARAGACILLKGPSVARSLYPSEGEREYGDVDLLVEPRAYSRASEVVRELGFLPVEIPSIDGHEHHAQTWQRPADMAVVDLHRRLPWVAAADEGAWRVLSAATETMAIGGASVRVLGPEALAVQLTLHLVTHPDHVQPLDDMQRAVAAWPLETWQGAMAVARELDALPAFRAALRMTPGGMRVIGELGLSEDMSTEVQLAAFGPPGALALKRIWAEPWPIRVRLLARQVVPPRAFMYYLAPDARAGRRRLAWAYVRRLGVIVWRLPRILAALARARRVD